MRLSAWISMIITSQMNVSHTDFAISGLLFCLKEVYSRKTPKN